MAQSFRQTERQTDRQTDSIIYAAKYGIGIVILLIKI